MSNANRLQEIISDDLFPTVQHVSDVKQVLEFMRPHAQPLREEQVRAILFLQELGNNKLMHPDGNPYEKLIKKIEVYREVIADPEFFLDTIESLVPKPPKPILMAGDGTFKKVQPQKG